MNLSEKKHVLVTGAAGFIGGYVVEEFIHNDWAVSALVHRRVSEKLERLVQDKKIAIVKGDAADKTSLIEAIAEAGQKWSRVPDVIVHCAGRASDVGWKREFRRANFDSVRFIGEWVGEKETRKIIFVSTTDVYGLRDFGHEKEEDLPLCNNKNNPYPEYKILAEQWLVENLQPEQYGIVQPASVWGVGDTTMTARAVDFLRVSPWIIHFGHWKGRNRWPMAHVRNVAAGIYLAAVRSELAGKAVHILDSEFTSCDDFYRIIAGIYLPGKKFGRICLPLWLGKAFGGVVSLVSNLFNLDRPITDPSLYALHIVSSNLDFDNQRFVQIMKKVGRHVWTREEGIVELRKSFRQD
ncbi:MAG: SDR family NAD(P)-dependent oxidoreductase [Desulfobacteraceae bacterium]|nr:MAG: SDR family NAD(P)-dependent oxidoreductase [Desulfobacteraceae bacterium]